MLTKLILVHSSDGEAFTVRTSAKSEAQLYWAIKTERRFAESKTAAELRAHGGYAWAGWGNAS
jgi:hypothetical protein